MGTNASMVKYGSYDVDEAEKEKEDLEAGSSEFLKLKKGRNVVRVLPPPVGKRKPSRATFQHFIEFPGVNRSFICARLEAKKPCKICQKADELKKSSNKQDQKIAESLFARRSILYNVIDRNDEEKGPQVMRVGKTIHEQLVELRTDEDAGGDFSHPIEGYDVTIVKTGEGKNGTKYKVLPHKHTSQLSEDDDTMQQWIDMQADLDKFCTPPDQEEIEEILENEGDEEAETPPNRRLARGADDKPAGRTRRARAEDDAIDVEGEEVEAADA